MKFTSLGSGSRGNALIVQHHDTVLLIDCGIPIKAFLSALARIHISVEDLDAVFITHEHGDHIKGLRSLLRRKSIPTYMTRGTAEVAGYSGLPELQVIADLECVPIGRLTVKPVVVPHDAREPCQYVIGSDVGDAFTLSEESRSLGVITDLGSCSQHIIDHYKSCDAYVLECNHDVGMLQAGPYPASLKRRVLGDWGHLSNLQASSMLAQFGCHKLQWLVLAHLSQQNNKSQYALDAIGAVFSDYGRIKIADQDNGFDWLEIA